MGRGRQKAKQTKVARQLKYFSPDTDYNALQRELHGPDPFSPPQRASAQEVPETPETDEEESDDGSDWSRYSATDDTDDWATRRRA